MYIIITLLHFRTDNFQKALKPFLNRYMYNLMVYGCRIPVRVAPTCITYEERETVLSPHK